MNNVSAFLALVVLCLAEAVFANGVATTANGDVQIMRGTSRPSTLRQGDEVNQGDTIITGRGASVVLKFEDGQIAALGANSRMTITAYQYNAQRQSGNVLLSLIRGGMRTITGLIGRNAPSRVSYRVASATIGIRGTDELNATDGGNITAVVLEGSITVTVNGVAYVVDAGEGIDARTDGTFRKDAADRILQQLPDELRTSIGELQRLTSAIERAAGPAAATLNNGTPNPAGGVTGGGGTGQGPVSPN